MLSLREFINENFDNYEKFRNHTCTFNPGARPILNGKYSVHTEKAMPGKMYYKVKHKNKEIGSFYLSAAGDKYGSISVTNASVNDKHQRQGIASSVYDMIEHDTKHIGMPLYPQGKYSTSEDARAFWRKRAPEKLKELGIT